MSIEQSIARLDEMHGRANWSLYRAAMEETGWVVQVPHQSFSDLRIESVLDFASACVPLPVIPRAPTVTWQSKYEVRKLSSGKWGLWYDGHQMVVDFKTRKAANEAPPRWVALQHKAMSDWREKYGRVSMGVEGVDFRYED